MIGCRTLTPAFEATAPVRNGNAADPACPVLAENPSGYNVSMYSSPGMGGAIPTNRSDMDFFG